MILFEAQSPTLKNKSQNYKDLSKNTQLYEMKKRVKKGVNKSMKMVSDDRLV